MMTSLKQLHYFRAHAILSTETVASHCQLTPLNAIITPSHHSLPLASQLVANQFSRSCRSVS